MNKIIWTKEKLQEECNKYETVGELNSHNGSAYNAARRLNIIYTLFENHPNSGFTYKQKKAGYWTIERLQEECNKYETVGKFQKDSPSAYNAVRKQNLFSKLFKNHKNGGYLLNKKGFWTNKILQIECDKYNTRKEFRDKNYPAYIAAKKQKLLNELFKNHKNKGYSIKNDWKDNRHVIYVYEITNFNKAYVGLTNNIQRRDREHLFRVDEVLMNFCKKNNLSLPNYKILEERLSPMKAKERENYWLEYYKNNNWEMLNVARTGSLGGSISKWNKRKLQVEANKYKNRKDFRTYCSNGYDAALKRKLLDELFINHCNRGYTRLCIIKKL